MSGIQPGADYLAELLGRPPSVVNALVNWLVCVVLLSGISILLQLFFLQILGQATPDQAFGKGELLPLAAAVFAAAMAKRLTQRITEQDMALLGLLLFGLVATSGAITGLWLVEFKGWQGQPAIQTVEDVSAALTAFAIVCGAWVEIGYARDFRSRLRIY